MYSTIITVWISFISILTHYLRAYIDSSVYLGSINMRQKCLEEKICDKYDTCAEVTALE